MSEMVERAADALQDGAVGPLLAGLSHAGREQVVREVLRAIREPTDAMAEVAFNDGWAAMTTDHDDFKRWWRAMIDEALRNIVSPADSAHTKAQGPTR